MAGLRPVPPSSAGFLSAGAADQLADADRIVQASVKRLEGRVRALEGQGVRGDRRAAELAGLAQALTEEQRALLIRLDRLEEQVRSGALEESAAAAAAAELKKSGAEEHEDVERRFVRLEREQRAAALNMRLIVSVTEEAHQRQVQLVRSLEEKLEAQASATAASAASASAPAGGLARGVDSGSPAASGAASFPGATLGGVAGPMNSYLRAHEREFGSTAGDTQPTGMAQLRARLEAVASTGLGGFCLNETAQLNGSFRGETQELQHCLSSLAPRTDALEARLRVLTDAVEELQRSGGSGGGGGSGAGGCVAGAWGLQSLTSPLLNSSFGSELETANYREVTQRLRANEGRISEIVARLDRLPTQDSVLSTCRDLQTAQSGMNEELRHRLEDIASQNVDATGNVLRKVGEHGQAIRHLRGQLDLVLERAFGLSAPGSAEVPRAEDVAKLGTKVEEQAKGVTDLKSAVFAQLSDQAHAVAELSARLTAKELTGQVLANAVKAQELAELHGQLRTGLEEAKLHFKEALAEVPSKADLRKCEDELKALPSRKEWDSLEARSEKLSASGDELRTAASDLRAALQAELATVARKQEVTAGLEELKLHVGELEGSGTKRASELEVLVSRSLRELGERVEQRLAGSGGQVDRKLEEMQAKVKDHVADALRSQLDDSPAVVQLRADAAALRSQAGKQAAEIEEALKVLPTPEQLTERIAASVDAAPVLQALRQDATAARSEDAKRAEDLDGRLKGMLTKAELGERVSELLFSARGAGASMLEEAPALAQLRAADAELEARLEQRVSELDARLKGVPSADQVIELASERIVAKLGEAPALAELRVGQAELRSQSEKRLFELEGVVNSIPSTEQLQVQVTESVTSQLQQVNMQEKRLSELEGLVEAIPSREQLQVQVTELVSVQLEQGKLKEQRVSDLEGLVKAMPSKEQLQAQALEVVAAHLEWGKLQEKRVSELEGLVKAIPSKEQLQAQVSELVGPQLEQGQLQEKRMSELETLVKAIPSKEQLQAQVSELVGPQLEQGQLQEKRMSELETLVKAIPSKEQLQAQVSELVGPQLEQGQLQEQRVSELAGLVRAIPSKERLQAQVSELVGPQLEQGKLQEKRMSELEGLVKVIPSKEQLLAQVSELVGPQLEQWKLQEKRVSELEGLVKAIPPKEQLQAQIAELVRPQLEQGKLQEKRMSELETLVKAMPSKEQLQAQVSELLGPQLEQGKLQERRVSELEGLVKAIPRSEQVEVQVAEVVAAQLERGQLHATVAALKSSFDKGIADVHARLLGAPSRNYVQECIAESLKTKLEGAPALVKLRDSCAKVQTKVEQRLTTLEARLDDMPSKEADAVDEQRLKPLEARVSELAARVREVASNDQVQVYIGEFQSQLQDLPSRDQLQSSVAELQAQIHELTASCPPKQEWQAFKAHVSDLRSYLDTLSESVSFERLFAKVAPALKEQVLQGLGSAPILEELRKSWASAHRHVEAFAEDLAEIRRAVMPGLGDEGTGDAGGQAATNSACEELSGEVKELRALFAELQETVDQRVIMSVWQVQKQHDETTTKVERLLAEAPERLGKLEEGEVRLSVALTRLSAQEQKVQGCMDRLDRVPTLCQVRTMWREELHKRFEEADVDGLMHHTRRHARALEEHAECLQALTDRFFGFGASGSRAGEGAGAGSAGQCRSPPRRPGSRGRAPLPPSHFATPCETGGVVVDGAPGDGAPMEPVARPDPSFGAGAGATSPPPWPWVTSGDGRAAGPGA